MNTVYWFALIVGGGLLLLSVLGDLVGEDVPVDADAGGGGALQIFSLRNATYALFGLGATGLLLGWLTGLHAALVAGLATAVAIGSGGLAAATFGWLRRSQSGELSDDASLIGRAARVTLPLGVGSHGKIAVERGGREVELLAAPFETEPSAPETWSTVVIVDMDGGIALVSPYANVLEEGAKPELPSSPSGEVP